MTDRVPYEPTYAEPQTVEEMRFWVRNELDRISRATVELAADSGGGTTPTRNYQFSTVNGTFQFQTFLTLFTTAPAIVSANGNPIKIETFITCSRTLRVRIGRTIDGGALTYILDISNLSLSTGNTAIPLDYVDSTITAGQSVVYRIEVQADVTTTERTDSLLWVEEA